MNSHPHKIPVGISSCLLGQQVRYDGGHKSNDYIRQTLGEYFEFIPFCPEVESGMSIPRPPVQLRYTDRGIRCVGAKDHSIDVTDQLNTCSERQRHWLQGLCGYILKKDSPSCGMARVKIYKNDYADRVGTGLFAQFLKENFPLLPLEEEGRLGDPHLRENFIQRVYVLYRWQRLCAESVTPNHLTRFHSQHKLIAMSHDQNQAHELGRLAASADKTNIQRVMAQYSLNLMQSLKKIATRGNHVNVLQHIQGYLKKNLDADDKAELSETIERYRLGIVPLIVPITLLKHHFRKQPNPFIEQSYYMSPYPEELTVLNEI
ncbi:MAG: YbgA family protein [Gammaproteobacteria bacterium]